MSRILLILFLPVIMMSCKSNPIEKAGDYPVTPVDFTQVSVHDNFWSPRLDTNRMVTIPYTFRKAEETGRIANFAVAGKLKKGKFVGIRYNDSDVLKIMEGASYSLMVTPDPRLEAYLDSVIILIAAAQEKDGYLYTCRTINPDSVPRGAGKTRWSQLKDSHELYNIGHMYEAAAAHHLATGKNNFLDVALKSADLVCRTFGPGANQLHGVPGHQEIEIGLVKLYRITHKVKYLDMARYFLDQRGNAAGHELYTYGDNKMYTQDHMPVVKQSEAIGHAVRAAYMYSAMTDIAALTGDKAYNNAVHTLWDNVTGKKMYITGGIGSRYDGEAFGENYELPDLTAYNETCAAIAMMLWNQRMFLLTGEAKFIDVLERTLYNNFLAGVSIRGNEFFYPNPLESDGSQCRSPWFDCACCPTNVTRFLPSLPGYIYASRGDEIFVNLYMGNHANIKMGEDDIVVTQQTNYPWDGKVNINLEKAYGKKFTMALRIPGWARNEAVPGNLYRFASVDNSKVTVSVNGESQKVAVKDGYCHIKRHWNSGDMITLELPMPVRTIFASDSVADHHGRMCLQRGPLVYAAEWPDNKGRVRNLMLEPGVQLSTSMHPDIADGIVALDSRATALSFGNKGEILKTEQPFMAIPYYAWAYRGAGEMAVWLPWKPEAASPTPPPTLASASKVTASYVYDKLGAVNDQVIPKSSSDQEIPRFTFWDHKGTEEWVQYDLAAKSAISAVDVYWFDDGPNGGCRVPASWLMQYKNSSGTWVTVTKNGEWPIVKDQFCHLEIVPVKTQAVRLLIKLQKNYSGGILEWKIL